MCPLFLERKNNRERPLRLLFVVLFAFSVVGLLGYGIFYLWQNESSRTTQKELQDIRKEADTSAQYAMQYDENGEPKRIIVGFLEESTGKKTYKVYEPRQEA